MLLTLILCEEHTFAVFAFYLFHCVSDIHSAAYLPNKDYTEQTDLYMHALHTIDMPQKQDSGMEYTSLRIHRKTLEALQGIVPRGISYDEFLQYIIGQEDTINWAKAFLTSKRDQKAKERRMKK